MVVVASEVLCAVWTVVVTTGAAAFFFLPEPLPAGAVRNTNRAGVTAIFTPFFHGRRSHISVMPTGKQKMNESTKNHVVSHHGVLPDPAGIVGASPLFTLAPR